MLRRTHGIRGTERQATLRVRAAGLVAFIMGFAFIPPLAFAESGAVVDGRVTDSVTNAGIAGVTVELTPDGSTEVAYSAQTDVAGAFLIADVPPGGYIAAFEKRGYAALLASIPVTQPVHVGTAGESVHLRADLARLTTLRGRVLDSFGHPLPEIDVEIATPAWPIRRSVTDSEGRFILENLRPGEWLLSATPPRRNMSADGRLEETGRLPPPEDSGMIWTTTYYPGVIDRAQAGPIRVRGGDLAGYDIRLRTAAPHKVSGIVASDGGSPKARFPVRIFWPGALRELLSETTSDDDGVFEFDDVPPGPWLVIAGTDGGVDLKGVTEAVVTTRDLENLHVRVAAPFPLNGRVEWAQASDEHEDHSPTRVLLIPTDRPSDKNEPASSEVDGRFQIARVYPGRYRILPLAARRGYYLASVKIGEQEVYERDVELASESGPIRILYKPGGGRVRGTVEKGKGAMVVLVPLGESQSPLWEFATFAQCDTSGSFVLENLRPGDYHALAFDRVDSVLHRSFVNNGAVWAGLAAQAVPIHVEESITTSIELKVTRWPDAN